VASPAGIALWLIPRKFERAALNWSTTDLEPAVARTEPPLDAGRAIAEGGTV
jgi:hypothetical protein